MATTIADSATESSTPSLAGLDSMSMTSSTAKPNTDDPTTSATTLTKSTIRSPERLSASPATTGLSSADAPVAAIKASRDCDMEMVDVEADVSSHPNSIRTTTGLTTTTDQSSFPSTKRAYEV